MNYFQPVFARTDGCQGLARPDYGCQLFNELACNCRLGWGAPVISTETVLGENLPSERVRPL